MRGMSTFVQSNTRRDYPLPNDVKLTLFIIVYLESVEDESTKNFVFAVCIGLGTATVLW